MFQDSIPVAQPLLVNILESHFFRSEQQAHAHLLEPKPEALGNAEALGNSEALGNYTTTTTTSVHTVLLPSSTFYLLLPSSTLFYLQLSSTLQVTITLRTGPHWQ